MAGNRELACNILFVHDNVTDWRRALMSFTDRLGFTVAQAVVAWLLVFLIGGAAGCCRDVALPLPANLRWRGQCQ